MSKSESLLAEASRILFEEAGISSDAAVVVGVSGGVDSMVLLHLAGTLGLRLSVLHVNYHQRGMESDADAKLVIDACGHMNVTIEVVDWHEDTLESGNFQDLARQFRRDQYQRLMHETGSEAILLGHNRDDVYETLLMRVLRGAAPSNWNALPAIAMPYVRPLIDSTRSDIIDYARTHNIVWREDSSNQKSLYARNFLRNEIIPQMDGLFPGWKSNIDRIKMYGEVYRMSLDQLLTPFGDASSLPVDWLMGIPSTLGAALIHRVHERHGLHISSSLPDQVLSLLHQQPGRMIEIDGTFAWHRDRNRITLDYITHDPVVDVAFSFSDLQMQAIASDMGEILLIDRPNAQSPVCLRAQEGNYMIRSPRKGDKIGIETGRKSVSDLLNEWGVPSRLKPRAYVLTLDDSPVAVIFSHPEYGSHWRIDPRHGCSDGICLCFNLHK